MKEKIDVVILVASYLWGTAGIVGLICSIDYPLFPSDESSSKREKYLLAGGYVLVWLVIGVLYLIFG